MIDKWSPDALLHLGAAPIYLEYAVGLTQPEGANKLDYHSPLLGLGFQKLAQEPGS